MNINVKILIGLLLIIVPGILQAQSSRLPKCETYTFVELDSALKQDVYRPEQPREDKAAVMTVFGGGFFSGARDNREMKQWAVALLERGFTVISIDYRLGFKDSAMVVSHSKLLQLINLFKFCIDIAT